MGRIWTCDFYNLRSLKADNTLTTGPSNQVAKEQIAYVKHCLNNGPAAQWLTSLLAVIAVYKVIDSNHTEYTNLIIFFIPFLTRIFCFYRTPRWNVWTRPRSSLNQKTTATTTCALSMASKVRWRSWKQLTRRWTARTPLSLSNAGAFIEEHLDLKSHGKALSRFST